MLHIYWLEQNPEFHERMTAIRAGMRARGERLCASTLTLCELLVMPERRDDAEASARIQAALRPPAVELLPMAADVAPRFAMLRAKLGLRTPDALHLAIAAAAGVDIFLTNDRVLKGVRVEGIGLIAGLGTELY